jgi:hypothetical protein
MVLNPLLILNFEVPLVGVGHCLCGQPFDVPVVVYEQWHRANPPFPRSPPERSRLAGLLISHKDGKTA